MLIHELAKKTGLTAHTIRFYEKMGLVKGTRDPKVKTNSYFHYSDETVDKLLLIKDAKAIGFTLSEISHLLEAWYGNQISIPEKLAILDEKLLSIEEKIQQLEEMKKLVAEYKASIIDEAC